MQKNNFNYSSDGILGLKKKIEKNNINIVFDATSAVSSLKNYKALKLYLNNIFYLNLTPSKIGDYMVPYHSLKNMSKKVNLITCGGQSSIPLIIEVKKILKNLIYVELVSSIASLSAGKATRENVNDYIQNTQTAISNLSGVKNNKVIINLNPSNPPVNMMNSIFFECSKSLSKLNLIKISKVLKNLDYLKTPGLKLTNIRV